MNKPLEIKIDVTKIDKSEIFEGRKGKYITLTVWPRDDDYGNCGMVVQSISKERRDRGEKGPILGNAKEFETPGMRQQAEKDKALDLGGGRRGIGEDDDIPF